ncbi:MAG TPA: hypothetical protein VK550_19745 [Polyangiaceae bacterium]|nr:hypothetical protein [Polyangiaceae bacterium]
MMTRSFAVLATAFFVLALGCGGRTPSGSQDMGGASGAGGGGALDDASTACTAGTVSFHFSAVDGKNASYCVGLGCSEDWMTIRTQQGAAMPLSLGCSTTCDDCRSIGCPLICPAPKQMKEDGERLTWDGTYWPDAMCGTNLTCRNKRCAAPGKYVVRMCGGASSSDAGPFCIVNGTPKCFEVEFEYPSATLVEGAI